MSSIALESTNTAERLLLLLSRLNLSEADQNAAKELIARGCDWARLRELSMLHGVFPLIARSLGQIRSPQVPQTLTWFLEAQVLANGQRNARLREDWLHLLSLFAKHQVRVIPIKGIALAESAYGDINLRAFSDLDFFVHEKDLDRSKQMLCENGYDADYPLPDFFDHRTRANRYEIVFFSRGPAPNRTMVELQFQIAPRALAVNVDTNGIFGRAVSKEQDGIPMLRMSSEDMLLYLCVHVWKHAWCRLKWICDLSAFLGATPVPWDAFFQQAAATHVEPIVASSLLIARGLVSAPIPEDALSTLNRWNIVANPYQKYVEGISLPPEFPGSAAKQYRFWMSFRPRLADRWQMFRTLLQPTETDFQMIRLPHSLFFVYYALRPFLLIWKMLRPETAKTQSHKDEALAF
ncbi:MAG TPA: nucleotidyltransferase family protein [Acidobacteriota bacterium]|nr:nucleotidyltransferase family protein [Acidobacteriota bacterium]